MQLLFCNTFSCDSQGPSGNWAVVKFPCMIAVEEIRVISPGLKAHPQLHDDQFAGKTSPNKFHVQIFSDDRSASMTTYEHVGSMEYIEGSPNRFRPQSPLYSEKLLLNGWFNLMTVAVYGGTLSDIGASSKPLELNVKTPSLIIHEKPEGRSVYIRGVQDLPPLTKDLEKPEPLMASFPSTNRNYSGQGDNAGRRDIGYQGTDNLDSQDMHSSYFDRRQGRNRHFGSDASRMPQKPYTDDRGEYPQRIGGRRTLLPNVDPETAAFRNDSDRLSYREKNRDFSSQQRSHGRHDTDDSDKQRASDGYQRTDSSRTRDARTSESHSEARDLRQSLERNRDESGASEEQDKEHTQEWMEGEYEEISDDEAEEERFSALQDMEDLLDGDLLSPSMCFNPFLMESVPLMHFSHPGMTDFEIAYSTFLAQQQDDPNVFQAGNEEDLARFESLVTQGKRIGRLQNMTLHLNPDQGKEWVSVAEEIIPLTANALPAFGIASRDKYDEYLSLMIAWVFAGLDYSLASKQAVGTNLRMLKCGINLAHKLCLTTQDIVAFLTELNLDDKLVELLQKDNMASSVKIMIIHALDAYLSWPSSVTSYFNENEKSVNQNYIKLIELMVKPQASRVATALSRLMNKLSLFHAIWKLKNTVNILVMEKIPSLGDQFDSDEEFIEEGTGDILEEDVMLEEEEEMVVMSSTSNDEDEEDEPNMEVSFRRMQAAKTKENKATRRQVQEPNTEPTTPVAAALAEYSPIPLKAVISISDVNVTQKDVDDIKECVDLLIHTLQDIKSTIAQLPKRVFPTESGLDEVSDKNSKSCLFRMLEFYQFLPSIQALLSVPVISGFSDIYETIYKMFDLLMSRQDGLLYISANSNCINCISKHLLSSSSNLSPSKIEMIGTAPHLGTKLAFHIQCIQCIDHLQTLSEVENTEVETSAEAVETLKVLYSLTFPTFGKYWVANILSLEDNIVPLLAYIQQVKEEDMVTKIDVGKATEDDATDKKKNKSDDPNKKKAVRKTAVGGYTVGILLNSLKMSQNVGHILRQRQAILTAMKGAPMARYIEEIHEWLRPLENLQDTGAVDVITPSMEFLKSTFAKLEWNTLMTSGPGLCTALRILCHLTNAGRVVHSESGELTCTSKETFRAALGVFAGGGLSVFVEGLAQLNKCFEYPCYSQHALMTLLSFNFHNLVSALSENLLVLTHHLLEILLSTEDGKFDPGHLTKLLLHHYSGMHTVLRESGPERLDFITEVTVSIFGVFVNKTLKATEENTLEDNRAIILKELVTNMQQHCQTMVPGLILLSHLLPMPFPIMLQNGSLDDDAAKSLVSQRNTWEQPLNSILQELCSFITVACQSICIPLLEALIPTVQQVIDLLPALATNVILPVLNSCATPNKPQELIPAEKDAGEKSKDEGAEVKFSFNSHPIVVLTEIAKQPSAKATILHCMREESNCLNQLWTEAKKQAEDGSRLLLSAAVKLAKVLVDPDTFMVPLGSLERKSNSFDISVPHLVEIVHLACTGLNSPSLTTVEDSYICSSFLLRSEEMFKELKTSFCKRSSPLFNALETILKSWSEKPSNTVLLSFCMFVKQLCAPEEGRPSYLTKSEIKTALNWVKDSPANHPLMKLKAKLEEMDSENDGLFDQTLDEITGLCESLKTSFEIKHKYKGKKPKKNTDPMSLSEQFKLRPVWINGDFDISFFTRHAILRGNLEASFILNNIRQEDKIKANLTENAETSCPGFNLENSFKELTESVKTTDIEKIRMEAKAKRLKKLETFSTRHGKTLTFIKRSHGPMSSNTRGRGRGRVMSSGRHYDSFRQRKQNTSRPPSMHVDDFLAADEEDSNPISSEFAAPTPPAPSFVQSRRAPMPFKREFIPRGRGSRGMGRGPGHSRGGFSNFMGTVGRPQDRFPRGRGRGRDPTRSFSPRGGFKPKPQSWSFSSPRTVNAAFGSPGGFRGGRVKSLMRIGRPLLPPPPMGLTTKWGGMPPPRRGRGYFKPRGKHIRSFTR